MVNGEFSAALADNDVELVARLFPDVLHGVDSSTCERVKGLPGGDQGLGTVKAFCAAVEALIERCKAKAAGPPKKGHVRVLVVTPSAPRAASLCGVLARGGASVAKLFGRHLTVDEQAAHVAGHFVDVAVGTPNRLGRLAAMGALELKALRWVLIDSTPDAKQQTFFTCDRSGERRPDGDELVALLRAEQFVAAFGRTHAPPAIVPCLLPPKAALEAATPIGQRMLAKARGKGGGGGGRGRHGGKGGGRGGGRLHGAIEKRRRK